MVQYDSKVSIDWVDRSTVETTAGLQVRGSAVLERVSSKEHRCTGTGIVVQVVNVAKVRIIVIVSLSEQAVDTYKVKEGKQVHVISAAS